MGVLPRREHRPASIAACLSFTCWHMGAESSLSTHVSQHDALPHHRYHRACAPTIAADCCGCGVRVVT